MDISLKELIVTFCINTILFLTTIACVIVLKGSVISLVLSLLVVVFILISTLSSWSCVKHIDEE